MRARAAQQEAFATKNAARAAFTRSTDREKFSARKERRALGGAFGHEPKAIYNHLVIGTTGSPH